MGEFLVELVGKLLELLVPRRVQNRLSAVLLIVLGVGFAGLAAFVVLKVVRDGAEPVVLVAALLFLGVSLGCFRFARKVWLDPTMR